jgi:hypothetical protein
VSLWDRQENESYPAYRAFSIYRDLGSDRSIDHAWRKFTSKPSKGAPGTWNLWCSKHQWVERAAAYDAHLIDIEREAFEREYAKLAERRARFELRAQELIEHQVERIDAVLKKVEDAPATDTVAKTETEEGKVVTREKGINLSGYAKLLKERREAIEQAVTGVRKVEDSAAATQEPKQVLPDWLVDAYTGTKEKDDAQRSDIPGSANDLRASGAHGNPK